MPDLNLHQIARSDVFLGASHSGQIVRLGEAAFFLGDHAGMAVGDIDWLAKLDAQVFETLLRAVKGFGLGRVRVDHQVNATCKIVDDHKLVGLQQQDVWWSFTHASRIGFHSRSKLGLDVADGVVAKVACQTTCKTGHARTQGHLEAALVLGNKAERIAFVCFDDFVIAQQNGLGATSLNDIARGQTNKGVATKAFAANDGLEQAGIFSALRPGMGQFEINTERRVQIGVSFGDQRDSVVALGR